MKKTIWSSYLVLVLMGLGLFQNGHSRYTHLALVVPFLVLATAIAHWNLPTWNQALGFLLLTIYCWVAALGCAYFARECEVEADRAIAHLD